MEKSIKISYGKLTATNFTELNDFQGELKELSDESYEKLKKEILETGFSFAPHAWKDPKKNKLFLLDGHQRIKTIRRLAKDGYKIPKIPVVIVDAKSLSEAKRKVLMGVSQFGHLTQQGLFDFINEAKLNVEDIVGSFDLPGIDLEAFKSSFFDDVASTDKTGSTEITEGEIASKLVHTCPKCSFKFS